MTQERILFICKCEDPAHQMIATYYPDDDVKAVFMEVLLDPNLGFWQRLIYSWRYIWCPGRRNFGYFTEVILTEDHLPSLRKLVHYLEKS